MASYKFFQNRSCEYFPCHQGIDEEQFNCLFCYCPLYALGDKCGGKACYTQQGIKDCSNCTRPHEKEKYDDILKHMELVLQMAKKP